MTSLPIAGAGRHTVYTGRTTCWSMVAGCSVGALSLVLMSRQPNEAWGHLAVPLLLVAVGVIIYVLTSSSLRATAGPNGLTIHWGLIGWPRCNYSLDEIQTAEVIDLPWWRVSWGFWWTPKGTSCTLRSGPTVRLTLRNDRTVTVTVPDPQAAVATLRAASERK